MLQIRTVPVPRGGIGWLLLLLISVNIYNFLQGKAVETTKEKEEWRTEKPMPDEHEDMPQHQHSPLAKRRGDRNPKYHEEQHEDVA
jgi:hypothetical protein